MTNEEKVERDQLISYAVKEGFIHDDVENWTEEQKDVYYQKSLAYEPEE